MAIKHIIKNVLAKTQAKAKEKLKVAIEQRKGLDVARGQQYTLGQWMGVWYEYYAQIKPAIGAIPLTKLTTLDLQKLYQKLLTEGRVERKESEKQSKGLSPKTLRNINQVISSAMQIVIQQHLISHDPTDGCALPKTERREMQTLSADQHTAFLLEAKHAGVFEMYYIELAIGLRRGELLGLKRENIDFTTQTLRVRRQVGRINGEVREAPLKTKNAYRTISLGTDAVGILKQQREKHPSSSYVFPGPTGGPIAPDSVLHMLHRVLDRAGLPELRFHDLRHTFATLGHFSAGFTLDTYAHVTTAAQKKAAETMGEMLAG